MAAQKAQPSFDDIIQQGRKKKQADELATRLLGSGRRASAPTVLSGRKGASAGSGAGSFASRVGISKQNTRTNTPPTTFKSSSQSQTQSLRGPKAASLSRSSSNPQLNRKAQALGNALSGTRSPAGSSLRNQVNIVDNSSTGVRGAGSRAAEINVRGSAAGPYTVRAQNFAPGTTAADIETVLVPERDHGMLISCKLIAVNPTVIAELVFTEKSVADSVIAKYNNKKADGRQLYVYLHNTAQQKVPAYNRPRGAPLGTYSASEKNTNQDVAMEEDYMELEVPAQSNARNFNSNKDQLRANPDYQDGSYGFPEPDRSYDRSANDNQGYSNGRYDNQSSRDRNSNRGRDGDQEMGGLQSDRMLSSRRGGGQMNSRQGTYAGGRNGGGGGGGRRNGGY